MVQSPPHYTDGKTEAQGEEGLAQGHAWTRAFLQCLAAPGQTTEAQGKAVVSFLSTMKGRTKLVMEMNRVHQGTLSGYITLSAKSSFAPTPPSHRKTTKNTEYVPPCAESWAKGGEARSLPHSLPYWLERLNISK